MGFPGTSIDELEMVPDENPEHGGDESADDSDDDDEQQSNSKYNFEIFFFASNASND